ELLLDGGRLDEAAAQLARARELSTGDARPYTALGLLWQRRGDRSRADDWLRQAQERAPDDPWTWSRRADNMLQAGQPLAAKALLTQATARFPSFAHAYFLLARAEQALHETENATASIQVALRLDPTGNAWYWVTTGSLYMEAGRCAEAGDAFR